LPAGRLQQAYPGYGQEPLQRHTSGRGLMQLQLPDRQISGTAQDQNLLPPKNLSQDSGTKSAEYCTHKKRTYTPAELELCPSEISLYERNCTGNDCNIKSKHQATHGSDHAYKVQITIVLCHDKGSRFKVQGSRFKVPISIPEILSLSLGAVLTCPLITFPGRIVKAAAASPVFLRKSRRELIESAIYFRD